jgi:putative hydrolase of the HAD superfamily
VTVSELKAIVFDLDDTLFLERDYALSGFRAVAEWVGGNLGIPAEEAYSDLARLFDEGVLTGTFDAWLIARGRSLESVPAMVQVFRDHDPEIAPVPAASRILEGLRSRYALALVSDGYSSVQRKKLAALGLEDSFDTIVFSDDHGRAAWKPNPLPFQIALDALGVLGHDAVYVADNPVKDFLGARRAGMWSVRVRWPEGVYRDVDPETPDHACDVEIDGLEDLIRAIETIERRATRRRITT